ncbi:hypothetical protein ACFPVT_08155 [Corynebacterium choanae]|uniref:hypothetical protein n=1 Tax=Corynebacterium choanae TaxID=1862358 RepID=UPI000F500194|nr:hypothetical protein [Corynebacterium choanae]
MQGTHPSRAGNDASNVQDSSQHGRSPSLVDAPVGTYSRFRPGQGGTHQRWGFPLPRAVQHHPRPHSQRSAEDTSPSPATRASAKRRVTPSASAAVPVEKAQQTSAQLPWPALAEFASIKTSDSENHDHPTGAHPIPTPAPLYRFTAPCTQDQSAGEEIAPTDGSNNRQHTTVDQTADCDENDPRITADGSQRGETAASAAASTDPLTAPFAQVTRVTPAQPTPLYELARTVVNTVFQQSPQAGLGSLPGEHTSTATPKSKEQPTPRIRRRAPEDVPAGAAGISWLQSRTLPQSAAPQAAGGGATMSNWGNGAQPATPSQTWTQPSGRHRRTAW